MSSDCCCALASVRSFWRGRRLLRLAACASVLLVGSASTSVLVATARAEDLPPPPAQSAQTDLDGTSTAPIASPESTTTEVTSDAVETPATTADGFETSTDISATASDTTVTASSSTDTSSTDTSTTATEATAGTTSEDTDAATDTAASSCTMDGAAIAPDAAGTVDNTTDGTDAASDTASTTVEADTTDSTHTCVEEQASANTAEPDNAAAPSDAAPADAAPTEATTNAPASTPITPADGDRGLQSHAGPVATSADGDSSSADARTASLAPEIATVSPTGDAQPTTDLADEVTPSDYAATAVAVGETLDVGSWTGSFGADQWQLESRFSGCVSALSAEGCAFSHVFVGQRGGGLHTAHVRERGPTEARGRSAPAQRPESPRRRAPERRLPVPTMPSSSAGAGASEGSHGGAVLGLISAEFGLLALAGIRALAHLERRPPTPPLISLLERPG
jgi:hypothetical protein